MRSVTTRPFVRRCRPPSWVLAVVALSLAPWLGGCVGRVIPVAEVAEPRPVYLFDHGRHASLALTRPEGGVVRYSYGEWRWYVEGRRNPFSAAAALLWPTRGGLGRQEHPEARSLSQLIATAPEGVARVHALQADAERVEALRRRLDAYFEAPGVTTTYSEEFDLHFVAYPRAYWMAHQSNLVVADWLRQLGFEVRGVPWLSLWRVEEER